jgi:hypothetical protein
VKRLIFLLPALLVFCSCSDSTPESTNTSSEQFSTLSERQYFLERYVNFRRAYRQLDFQVFYQNNSGGMLAGPSDWDIKILAQVPCNELDLWLQGFTLSKESHRIDIQSNLNVDGIRQWYQKPQTKLGLDKKSCIVFYHSSSLAS